VFISADPVYNPSKPKTINPYSYSVNNPTTYSDPGGAYSTHTFGLEQANAALTNQVRQLLGHIKRLNSHIADLQGFIKEMQSYIKDLLRHIEALEAEIARQNTIIRQLQAHIVALQREVWALRVENGQLRAHIARQNAVIGYYKGIVNVLGFRLWAGTAMYGTVMRSIHSFQGIPAGAFSGDNISSLQYQLSASRSWIDRLDGRIESLQDNLRESRAETRDANSRIGDLGDIIDGMAGGQAAQRNRIRDLENSVAGLEDALRKAHDYSGGDFLKDLGGMVSTFADVWNILCDSGYYQWLDRQDWARGTGTTGQYC
jgi:chromosome segregation ATPase